MGPEGNDRKRIVNSWSGRGMRSCEEYWRWWVKEGKELKGGGKGVGMNEVGSEMEERGGGRGKL